MSRYLKTASAAIYTRKKSYLVPGNYSFNIPVTSNEVKVMVFGGGGNACFAQVTTCGATGNCSFAMGGASGPGGGFTEKVYTGVGGQVGCVCVGPAQSNSYFCVCGLGTITGTGGFVCRAGVCQAWQFSPGRGIGGDTNTCGSSGATQCTFVCRFVPNTCCFFSCFTSGIFLSGGAPGNSTKDGTAPDIPTAGCTSNCWGFECICGQYFGYGCVKLLFRNYLYQNTNFGRGYGCCPVATDTYYGFDWDVYGSESCPTAGLTLLSGSAFCGLPSGDGACFASNPNGAPFDRNNAGVGCGACVCVSVQRIRDCLCGQFQPAGVTGAGGPGGNGGIGGGGGGVLMSPGYSGTTSALGLITLDYLNVSPTMSHCLHPCGCFLGTGGVGLVILYY